MSGKKFQKKCGKIFKKVLKKNIYCDIIGTHRKKENKLEEREK